jgi:hypothetical protein
VGPKRIGSISCVLPSSDPPSTPRATGQLADPDPTLSSYQATASCFDTIAHRMHSKAHDLRTWGSPRG